jgi:hypothetical protein
MSREKILAKVESLSSAPLAFEALWDGDSTGWFIYFSAVTSDGQSHPLGVLSDGSDIRLFNGQVPPWPEAIAAQKLGNELAGRYNAEFYFPSPDHPEDGCPAWNDRGKGYPCRRCGILLLQRDSCPWRGICYHCHLAEEREQREAKWSLEQRSGPRCHICGNPATNELNGGPVCADCFDKYEVYNCEKCGCFCRIAKSSKRSSLCRRCEIQNAVDLLTITQRNTILTAKAKSRSEGIDSVINTIGCSVPQAEYVLHLLGNSQTTETPNNRDTH